MYEGKREIAVRDKNMEHKLNKLKAVMSQQREERGVKTVIAPVPIVAPYETTTRIKSGATWRKYIKHNVHSWALRKFLCGSQH